MASKLVHRSPHDAVDELEKIKLMQRGPYDARDELEISLLQAFSSLQSQLTPPFQLPSQSSVEITRWNQALLCGMLTQPQMCQSLITHLAAITSDGYAFFVSLLLRLVNESYPKLLEQSQTQLLWLVRQLIHLSALDVDNLCLSLLRRIVGGDISPGNVWLSTQLLDLLHSNWKWLTGNSGLLTSALFTYLRLLPDHFMAKNPALNDLRQSEVAFCVQVLRDCFQDCLVIGRDLVRLLQDVAFIPEFESIWKDLLSNPTAFNAEGFADIAQLYVVRTPTRYLTSRITPEMEAQVRFMLTHVRWGSQRRYQAWFTQRFLSTPGSETLVCDLIRFICCVHHPTNQILQSDIVPRWAIVGWLLKCCKSHHVEANAKLALFYDWLFFMSKTDNIMNIEPALLLMVHSIPKYVDMTHSLLEFLFLCMEHYDPSRREMILRGVVASVDILVGKGVVRSLEPLSASAFVASWLREKLAMYFPTYCKVDSSEAFKAAKHEFSQQDSSMVSPVFQVGAKNLLSVQSGVFTEMEMGIGVDATFTGNYSQPVDIVSSTQPDKKLSVGSTDVVPHKRRCMDVITIEGLVHVLSKSQEEAISVFEKLLLAFLSEADNSTMEGNMNIEKGEDGFDKMDNHYAGDVGLFARHISDTLKENGYELFAPLSGHPPDTPEGDELMSLTAVILRMYIQSRHPQLLLMLLSWHSGGHAVGARFLCYVCRLVENLCQSHGCATENSCAESSLGSRFAMRTFVKQDKRNSCDLRTKEVYSSRNGEPSLQKKMEVGGMSALLWHKSMQSNGSQGGLCKNSQSKVSDATSTSQACCQPLLEHAFKAYEDYLRWVKRSHGGKSSAACTLGQCKLANGIPMGEKDEDDLESALLEDLETCLAWNVQRLLRVLPLVFCHLPQLSTGKKAIIRLLVSVLDPPELSELEFKLSLKEVSVFIWQSAGISKLIKSSLHWDCFEQQYFWRLLTAEFQNFAPSVTVDLLKGCTVFLQPSVHFEAMSGLFLFLKMQCPTTHLVSTMLFLPQEFGRLVAAVFASWMAMDVVKFSGCMSTLVLENSKADQERLEGVEHRESLFENLNISAVSDLLNFIENSLRKSCVVDEKQKSEALQIKCMLEELVKTVSLKSATFPMGAMAKLEQQ